jgi:hypothetical protein
MAAQWWALALTGGAMVLLLVTTVTYATRAFRHLLRTSSTALPLACALTVTATVCFLTCATHRMGTMPSSLFVFERYTNQASGLSVLPAMMMLAASFLTIAGCQLRRLQIAGLCDELTADWKASTGAGSALTVDERVKRRTHAGRFLGFANYALVFAVGAVPLIAVVGKTRVPFEGRLFGWVAHGFLLMLYVATLLLCARIFTLWHDSRALLRRYSSDGWFEVCRGWREGGPLDCIRWRWSLEQRAAWRALLTRLKELRARLVAGNWKPGDVDRLIEMLLVAAYARRQLAGLFTGLTVQLLLALILVSVYPFEIEHAVVETTWFIAFLLAGLMVMILVEQNRNEVLSVIDGSTPGQLTLDRDFLSRVGVHGLLPILAIAAAHSPTMGQFASSWLQPLLRFFGN